MASRRSSTILPSPALSSGQHSSHPAPLAPQGKSHEGIQGGHGTGTSHHSHSAPRRAPPSQLRHIDPFLEKCIEKFIQGSAYGRGVKPILKAAYVPGQKTFRFMPIDRLLPRDYEKLKFHLKYDERASQNPTWANRWMRVFNVAPRLEDSYLNVPMVVCKRSDSGNQPQVPLHLKETYMNIRDEQNRDTAVERICAGIKYAQMGLLEKALGEYTLAIEADPKCAAAYLTRGCTLANMLMWQEAVDDFRSVLKIDPSDASAQQYLATAMEEGRLQMTGNRVPKASVESQTYSGRNISTTGNGSMDVSGAPSNMQFHQHREAYGGDGSRVHTASIDTHIPHYNEQRTNTNAIPLGTHRNERARHHQSGDELSNDLSIDRHQSQEFDSSRGRRGEVHLNRAQHSTENPAHVRSRSGSKADNGPVTRRPSITGEPVRRRSPNMHDGAHGHLNNRAGRRRSRSPSLRNGRRYVTSSSGGLGNREGDRLVDGGTQYGVAAERHKERRSSSPWNSWDTNTIPTGPRIPEVTPVLEGSPRKDRSISPRRGSHQSLATPTKKRRGNKWGTSEEKNGGEQLNTSQRQHDESIDDNRQLNITSPRRSSVGEHEIIHFLSSRMESTIPAASATVAAAVAEGIPDSTERAAIAVVLSDKVQDNDRSFQLEVEDNSTFKAETGGSHSSGSHAGVHGGTNQVKALLVNAEPKDDQSAPVQNPAPAQNLVPEFRPLPSRRPGKKSLVTLDRSRDLSDVYKSFSSPSIRWVQQPVEGATPRVPPESPNVPCESSVNQAQPIVPAKDGAGCTVDLPPVHLPQ